MVTREQLVTAVVEDIEERGSGQSIAAEDADKIRGSLDACFADLLARNVILQPVGDEIDDAQSLHLKTFVAWKNARAFGLSGDATLAADGAAAEDHLRTISRINRGTRQTLRVDSALRPRRFGSFTRISG